MAIECDHPRPALVLPGYTPPRLAWQVPSYIPDLPPNAARVLQQALQGVYQELTRLGATRNLIPLLEDLQAQPGSVVSGVGDGQTITLLPAGAGGYLDPVSVLLTDVVSPVTVLHPDGSVTTLGAPGAYDFEVAGPEEYETSPAGSILSGSVPTDTLLGRDSAGTGAVEFITLTAPLEFDGAGSVRIADNGITDGLLRQSAEFTVIGKFDAGTGDVADIAIAQNSVLGRAGAAGTGDIEAITVPGTGTLTGEVVFLQSSSLRNHVRWSNLTLNALPLMDNNKFIGNVSGATARPTYTDLGQLAQDLFGIGFDAASHNFKLSDILTDHFLANISGATTTPVAVPLSSVDSTSLIYDGTTHTFQRAALTGDVTSAQNSNTVTVNANAITNAQLAQMLAGTVKGRQIDAGTGDPVDLTGLEVAELIRFGTVQATAMAATTNDLALAADADVLRLSLTGSQTLTGITGGAQGRTLFVENISGSGNNLTLASLSASSLTANRIRTPNGVDLVLRFRETAWLRWETNNGEWRVVASARATAIADADYGDITVTNAGGTWTIDNDVVSDAKLRNSAALSVIGRSANSTGDPADITAANDAEVLRRSGTTLGFGQVATAGLANNAVTDAKLRQGGALSVIGRSANSTGDVADIAAGTDGHVLRRSGTTLGFGQVATAGIADAAVTLAKLANLTAGTVIGKQIDASTGAPVALTGAEAVELLRWSTTQTETLSATTNDLTLNADTTVLRIGVSAADQTLTGLTGGVAGRVVLIENVAGLGGDITLASLSASSLAANRFRTPGGVDLVLRSREGCIIAWDAGTSDWRFVAVAKSTALADADYGDITVSGFGATWTIDNDVVSDAKLRNSAALSVIGRSANSTGDPADIAAGADGAVLRRSGTTLAFGEVATAGIGDNQVTDGKLRQGGACSIVGRSANTLGNVADISAATNDRVLTRASDTLAFRQISSDMIAAGTIALDRITGIGANTVIGNNTGSTTNPTTISVGTNTVLGREGGNIVAQQVATAQIANGAVSSAKIRDSVQLSVIGRSTNSTGVPGDIQAVNDGEVLRRSGTTLAFGQVANAGIAGGAVTVDKIENIAQGIILGRIATAGTGSPHKLTPSDVADILEGTVFAWSAGPQTFLAGIYNSSSIQHDSYVSSSETAVTDKAIGAVRTWRLTATGGPTIVGGMVTAGNGHEVHIINMSTTDFIRILPENGTTTAANRFAFGGTAIDIQPGRGGTFWYDPVTSRWRPTFIYV